MSQHDSGRERFNDAVRVLIDWFIAGCAFVFRLFQIYRMKTYHWNQAKLRRQYEVTGSTPVCSYDDFTRASIEAQFGKLGPTAVYACTSGSTRQPKKIAYDRKRLRKTRMIFVSTFFRYLACVGRHAHRTLFIFSSMEEDNSLTALLLKERGLPPYVSGLQAPHRVQNHPAIREAARNYGETAVRLWILAISDPSLWYATNPSTIATFLHETYEDWEKSRRLARDCVNHPQELSGALRTIHARIASSGASERLMKIARTSAPLPVSELFPSLQAFSCWDGGYVSPFLQQIRTYLPESQYRHWPMYSMSTETIETVAELRGDHPFFLPMASGVLYEFMEEGKEDLPSNILRPQDLFPGKTYSMVVSDAYGLRRYQTEDLFECVGMISGIPDLRFVSRRNLSYSFTGEKLTAEQLKLAYREAESSFPELRQYGYLTCFPSRPPQERTPRYRIVLVGADDRRPANGPAVARFIEQRLGEFNHEFKRKVESHRLGRMTFESIPIRDFVERISRHDKGPAWGSQFKFLPLYPKIWESL